MRVSPPTAEGAGACAAHAPPRPSAEDAHPDVSCAASALASVHTPWRCLCFGTLSHTTYRRPLRLTILHASHRRLIADRTWNGPGKGRGRGGELVRETPPRHLDLGFLRARARPDARATNALVRSRARPFVRTFMTTSREDARDAPRRCGAGGAPLERDTDGSPGARHSWRGRARVNANRKTGARYARQFRIVDRHTTTLVRGEQGCVRLAVVPQVSAPRDAQGVVHSGYTRRCRHDEVRALAPPFRRPRLPSIPLAFAPSRDPPAIVFRIRRISARPPTSAPLTFASPFPPSPRQVRSRRGGVE